MIGHVANATERIRVGAGGSCSPTTPRSRSPRPSGSWSPSIPGVSTSASGALRHRPRYGHGPSPFSYGLGAEEFPERFAELLAFAGDGFPEDHPFQSMVAMPADVALPPIWLLGSSGYSAIAAGEMGLGYAFAAHFSPTDPAPAMRAYSETLRAIGDFERPSAILAVAVVCAETDEERGNSPPPWS